MKQLILILILITISFSQKHFVRFNSKLGLCKLVVDQKDEFTIPFTLELKKGYHHFQITNEDSLFDHEFSFYVDTNSVFMVNKELSAYVRILQPTHTFELLEKKINKLIVEDGYSKDTIYFDGYSERTLPINSKSKKITLYNRGFIPTSKDIIPQPFAIIDVQPNMEPYPFFINESLKEIEAQRKEFNDIIVYTSVAVTGILTYLTYDKIQASDDDYQTYLHSKTNRQISSNYKKYQSTLKDIDLFTTLTVISSVTLSYFLFFETYTDLSDEYVDENKTTFQFKASPNHMGLTINF